MADRRPTIYVRDLLNGDRRLIVTVPRDLLVDRDVNMHALADLLLAESLRGADTAPPTEPTVAGLSQPTLRAARRTLHLSLAETDRDLLGPHISEPTKHDTCCAWHLGEWQRILQERRDGIVTALREVEALIEPEEPQDTPEDQRWDPSTEGVRHFPPPQFVVENGFVRGEGTIRLVNGRAEIPIVHVDPEEPQ